MSNWDTVSPYCAELANKASSSWPAIISAISQAETTRQSIEKYIDKRGSSEVSLVTYGSIARREATGKSDVDWTLLVDDRADPEHKRIAYGIEQYLTNEKLKKPSPGGAFGNIVFSHDLIHQIGGQEDTNQNTTQRILLLLESNAIGNDEAYRRVIRQIIERYLDEDLTFNTGKSDSKIPRFLFNDIARYWRTMAVDFASKQWQRGNKGWALRNIKLRMSRKLIYASGMLMCFSCSSNISSSISGDSVYSTQSAISTLETFVSRTPLENVAAVLLEYDMIDTGRQLMNAYDQFLTLLNDESTRSHLENLEIEKARDDKVFDNARDMSYQFQDALNALFFDKLHEYTKQYGVF